MDHFIWSNRPPSSTLRAFFLHSVIVLVVTFLLVVCVFVLNLTTVKNAVGIRTTSRQRGGLLNYPSTKVFYCDSKLCDYEARFINASVDWSQRPCTNFYKYACGHWKKMHQVANYNDERSLFTILKRSVDMDVLRILNATVLPEELQTPNQKAAGLLGGCVDIRTLNRRGLVPFTALLSRYGLTGWPYLESAQTDLPVLLGELTRRLRLAAFFTTSVSVNPKDTASRIVHLSDPDTIISKAIFLELNVLEKYRELVLKSVRTFKGSDDSVTNNIIHMEIDLIMATELKWKEKKRSMVRMSLGSIPQPRNWSWVVFLKTVLGDMIDVTNNTKAIVENPDYFVRLAKILDNSTRKAIMDYIGWRLLVMFSPFLPDAFRELTPFTLRGVTNLFVPPPRWYPCYEAVADLMQYGIAAAYAQRYLVGRAVALRKDVKRKYSLISERIFENIRRARWVHIKSSRAIQQKMMTVTPYLLYPTFVENEYAISAFYHVVPDVRMDVVFESYHEAKSALNEHYWQWLVEDWIGPEWEAPFLKPNVYFNKDFNTLAIPFGILQGPLYYTDIQPPVDIARFGFQLAREIIRAFFLNGPFFREPRTLKKSWDRLTYEEYQIRHNCLLHQYAQMYGKELNTYATIHENILDNAALPVAYRVYRKLIRKTRPHGAVDWVFKHLPDIDSDKMFFIAFATMFCDLKRTRALKMQLAHGPYSPAVYRVNVPLMNFAKFVQTYECKQHDDMYTEDRCAVWE